MSDTIRMPRLKLYLRPTDSLKKYHSDNLRARTSRYSKNYRFSTSVKNIRYNLLRKNEQLSLREHLTSQEPYGPRSPEQS